MPAEDVPAEDMPLRTEPLAAFETVRALFAAAPFDERAVAERLGIASIVELHMRKPYAPLDAAAADATDVLIRLFVDREAIPRAVADRALGPDGVRALGDVGLIVGDDDAGTVAGAVMVHPIDDVWIASDWVSQALIERDAIARDHVFSASNPLTRRYLAFLPDTPGARVLELCSGTGIAAIRAVKRGAAAAWATDVVPRCLHFMQFNARLNGVADRVTVVASDVWAALDGETFDLVAAHPPYVAALDHAYDYRDGGDDGEQISRRVLEGVAAHLRPGGRCVVRAGLTERTNAPIAARVRGWLGTAGRALDLAVLEDGSYGALDAYRATQRRPGFAGIERWLDRFHALAIQRFAICTVEVRRRAADAAAAPHAPDASDAKASDAARPPLTSQRVAGPVSDGRTVDWQFAWARYVATGPTPARRLRGERPRVLPQVRLAVLLQTDDVGDWHNTGATAETMWPSHGVVKLPALAPTLLELCDGTRETAAVHAALAEAGLIDADVTPDHVAHLVETLAEAGVVALAQCPPPPRDAAPDAAAPDAAA